MTQSDGLPALRRRSWDRRQNWPLGATFLLLLTLVSLLPGPGLVGHALSQPGAGQMPDVVLQPESNPYPWWNELNVLGHETPPPEMQNLVNGVVWGEWPQTKMLQEVIWRETARLHADGGRYVGCITMTGDRTEVFVEHPELNQARVIDIYGQPLEWGNGNHPLWQSFLLEQARVLVDIGADGILLDDVQATMGSIRDGGSFGEPDMTLFRIYLSQIYTIEELSDQFGIDDIDTFDYGDYIRDRGLADAWINTRWEVPLHNDYVRFQQRALVDFVARFVTETKRYARETRGRDMAVSANLDSLKPSHLHLADLLDYYTAEYPYRDYGYPPESQASSFHKLARALGNKPVITILDPGVVGDLEFRDETSTLLTLIA